MGIGLFATLVLVLLSLIVGAVLAWLAEPGQRTLFSSKARDDSESSLSAKHTSEHNLEVTSENNSASSLVNSSEQTPSQGDAKASIATSNEKLEQLIESINHKLPQTQCAQCGYPGCRPYATAIVNDDVAINQCPPGGDSLIVELAEYLGKPIVPLDSQRGETKPPQVAYIDEFACIGCILCISACPVDAIVGAPRFMHTVISQQCTGCELCLPPCPVDCIELKPLAVPLTQWRWPNPA